MSEHVHDWLDEREPPDRPSASELRADDIEWQRWYADWRLARRGWREPTEAERDQAMREFEGRT
jgi:hypothetical protein